MLSIVKLIIVAVAHNEQRKPQLPDGLLRSIFRRCDTWYKKLNTGLGATIVLLQFPIRQCSESVRTVLFLLNLRPSRQNKMKFLFIGFLIVSLVQGVVSNSVSDEDLSSEDVDGKI